MVISRISDTYAIRNGAWQFGSVSQDFASKVSRLKGQMTNLLHGKGSWQGLAAQQFMIHGDMMIEDIKEAGLIFSKISNTLNTLAGQLDQVNNLIQQSQSLQGEIDYLHHCINSTDDPNQKASYRSELQYYLNRRASLIAESEGIEYRAHQNAMSDFSDIEDMVGSLHFLTGSNEVKWDAWYSGTSKHIGLYGNLMDASDAWDRLNLGFGVKYQKTKSGRMMAYVEGGAVEGINGTKYYTSNGKYYPQVMKYVDGKTAAVESLKDIKGLGTAFGYASVAYETGDHLVENIQEGRSTSHIVAEATVDVGVGVASMAASAYAGAEIGAVFGTFCGGPIGTAIGFVGGAIVGVACTLFTDGLIIDGKSINDHMKDGLEAGIDGVTNECVHIWEIVNDLFE